MNNDQSRRLRVLYVPEQAIMTMFVTGKPAVGDAVYKFQIREDCLPEDVVLRSVYHDPTRACFGLVLQSAYWPVVPNGSHLTPLAEFEARLIKITSDGRISESGTETSWRDLPSLI